MAMKLPKTTYQNMMKDGTRSFQGIEEAVLRNIEAVKEFAKLTKTSFGCNGMKKLVVNRNQKVFITNDAATILKELEIKHPAANIIAMASKMQEQEVGDGSNYVIIFSASLLAQAEELIHMGMAPCEIIEGYSLAALKVEELLPSFVCHEIENVLDISLVTSAVRSSIASKQYAYKDILSSLVSQACVSSKKRKENDFNVDNVRTIKIPGASVESSHFLQGLVFKKECEGVVKEIKSAKIAVFTVGFDLMNTETKGTVLLNTASELFNFTKGEESRMSDFVSKLTSAGINVVVTSDRVSDQALDFANRQGIMVVRLISKFDILRLCRATRATPLPTLRVPSPEEYGHCQHVYSSELGDTQVVVFNEEKEDSALSTIVIRGSSESVMDDVERAIDDGVNCYKSVVRSPKLLAGAGAFECQLYQALMQYSKSFSDLKQYAVAKFAEACLAIPKILAENKGFNSSDALALLEEQHAKAATSGQKCFSGLDVDSDKLSLCDVMQAGIFDGMYTKRRALQLACHAATTILSIDQIVMAKTAGGPNFNQKKPAMDDD